MKNSYKTAFGGLVTALGTVFMLLSSPIPFFEYAVPAAAGILILFMQAQTGKAWALGVYAATCLLGVFVIPNKESVAMYIALFGIYPIIKSFFEKLPKWLAYVTKSVYFVAVVIAVYYVLINVIGISQELMEDMTKFTMPLLIIAGLAAFLFFDRALTLFEIRYNKKYKDRIDKLFSSLK